MREEGKERHLFTGGPSGDRLAPAAGAVQLMQNSDAYATAWARSAQIGSGVKYLKDGTEVEVCLHNDTILNVELPVAMDFEVIETDPGLRGDTASGGSKPAKVETGAMVNVPLFVNVGERIRVDTRSDSYLERVK